jgi:alcohol dehydrogenase class IV
MVSSLRQSKPETAGLKEGCVSLPDFFEFLCRPRILYGPGVVREVGFEAQKIGGSRAVIVTDKVLRQTGLVDRVVEGLAGSGVAMVGIFDDVPPNSEVLVVERGAALARGWDCDVLIAIGGGSVIDTAKGMNIVLSEGGALLDYEGAGMLNRPLRPLIAIPTTAGTGSEITIAAVIKDDARGIKLEFSSPFIPPNVAILDPELTLGLPPGLTASTGMDALTHAIEAYVSPYSEPICDALGLHAMRMIAANLPLAVRHGDDLEARGNMLLAAALAGMSFSNALCGVVHAMAHACGGRFSVPHGVANAILLPFGMEFNLEAAAPRLAEVAAALGVDVAGRRLDAESAARAGIAALRQLIQDCGLPVRLSQVGVRREGFAEMAGDALGDAMMISNPRPATEEEIVALYERAF